MKYFKGLFTLALALICFYGLNNQFGKIPALGKFLSPFTGFWQNAVLPSDKKQTELHIEGLKDSVSIYYDNNHVPHIFAQNNHDLYLAQGYITAVDRLWQMEFQTMAAAGRISEVVGPLAKNFDLHQRRMGMVFGAKQSAEVMMADSISKQTVLAYTAGINAYINQLEPKKYPFEYKLLGYAPEQWTPLKCALLLKQMTNTLNGGSDDLLLTNILAEYGSNITKMLFPNRPFMRSPIIPRGTEWNFEPIASPPQPDSLQLPPDIFKSIPRRPEPGTGSNNWALSGSRTASGNPILANDPHLDLTLPSIWYQIQLHAPGINVYGVSLPGAPGVVIGFNNKIAWGVTNTGSDVLDFYRIQFKNKSKNSYLLDGKWMPTKKVLETIRIKNADDIVDTVYYTLFGPVAYETGEEPFEKEIPIGYAVKWIAHEGGNELKTFFELNRAKNYDDYVNALQYYVAPAQNFVFASTNNDIAMWVNGKFPLKWKTQGKFLLDGTKSTNDWNGWIPQAHNPHVLNPERGFVSSSNQFSADSTYPYYLGWEYSEPERAFRINQLLSAMHTATIDSVRLMQSDSYKKLAQWALPAMLTHIDTPKLQGDALAAFELLAKWDYNNQAEYIAPSIFENWWINLENGIWSDDFQQGETQAMRFPSHDRTIHLLTDEQTSQWYDNVETSKEETINDIVTASLLGTIDSLTNALGKMGDSWKWGTVKGTHVPHLLKIPALGSDTLFMGGGKGTINALNDHNGPSWRMVVELSDPIKAYGLYPGGQSGNPGSPFYANMIKKWQQGQLNKLLFMQSPQDYPDKITHTIVLNK